MNELQGRIEQALYKAAEYEMLGGWAADSEKREEYRTLARFQRSIAEDLRRELSSQSVGLNSD